MTAIRQGPIQRHPARARPSAVRQTREVSPGRYACPCYRRPMAEIQLRRARTDDLEEIRAMLVELGYGELAHDEELAGTLKLVLNDPGRAVWLAERKGNVLGMISLEMRAELRLAGLRLTVEELVVRETARGHGVGTHLLDRAKAEAQRVRAKRVELLTNRGRAAYQRRFYAERGFIEVSSAVMRWSPTPST